MTNKIITNPKTFKNKLEIIKKETPSNFFVLSDFDGTLTKVLYRGKPRPSLISVLRNGNYLTEEYSQRAKTLYEKYNPFVHNLKLSFSYRSKKMEEWWKIHYDLLRKSGLKRQLLEKIVDSKKIKLREGIKNFFNILKQNKIPIIIISSGGLGRDIIKMTLKKERQMLNNIFIISNQLKWNKKGEFIGVKKPIIHSLNKKGTIIKQFPHIWKQVKNRKNALVLGNDISDLSVLEGLRLKQVIKIGFLNENTTENLKSYKKYFDFLVLSDGPLTPINELLKKIL